MEHHVLPGAVRGEVLPALSGNGYLPRRMIVGWEIHPQ